MSTARTFRYSYRKFGFVAKLTVNNIRRYGFHMDFCTFVSTQFWPFNGLHSLKNKLKKKKINSFEIKSLYYELMCIHTFVPMTNLFSFASLLLLFKKKEHNSKANLCKIKQIFQFMIK